MERGARLHIDDHVVAVGLHVGFGGLEGPEVGLHLSLLVPISLPIDLVLHHLKKDLCIQILEACFAPELLIQNNLVLDVLSQGTLHLVLEVDEVDEGLLELDDLLITKHPDLVIPDIKFGILLNAHAPIQYLLLP